MQAHDITAELSRPVAVDSIGDDGVEFSITADAGERTRLAERLGVDGIDSLTAHARLRRASGGRIRVDVDFSAEVLQSCVISLEPVTSRVRDHFVEVFVPGTALDELEVVIDPVGEDPPELVTDGLIDVGELVVQYLALAIDPYPRRADADLSDIVDVGGGTSATDDGEGRNPFAALAARSRADGKGAGR